MVEAAQISDIDYSVEDMEQNVARFKDQKSSAEAFIDTRIPGHERDIYTIIGGGVVEDADMRPPIEAQDFHLAFARCEPGKGAALHSHLTQEVFMPISGRWSIFWGDEGEKEVVLEPCDVVSVPTQIMRGFRNVGDETAMLLAIVGGNDPGHVGWAKSVIKMARAAGIELDDTGNIREVGVS